MLKNYIKIALRSLLRNKGFSIINISGLAIGMASAILILLWIHDELSYDRFHHDEDRLFEVWTNDVIDGAIQTGLNTPQLMGPIIKQDFPEVDNTARIGWNSEFLCSYHDKILKANGTWADPSFLELFNFPLITGNPKAVMADPYSLVITQKMASNLFGNSNPLGKIVKMGNAENFTVTGVLKDLPSNTQFDFEFLLSSELLRSKGYFDADWTDVSIRTYVKLKSPGAFARTNAKMKNIIIKYSAGRAKTTAFLYPVSKLRLYSEFKNGKSAGGRIATVTIFGTIAGLILLIACINFMNLSTAKSEKRSKEVGIRKVMGALKKSLVSQFLGESVLIAFVAGILALFIVQFCLPAFNQLTGKHLYIEYGNLYFWMVAIGFILITGILAGSYPAFFISGFKPVRVLKGIVNKVNALILPRKILVVIQFSFAIALVICTLVIKSQIKYASGRSAGYERNNLIYVPIEGDIRKNYQQIKNQLLNSGAALAMSQTLSPLTQSWSSGFGLSWQGKDQNNTVTFNRSSTDGDLVKTAGMKLVQGRDIDILQFPSDSTACIINESAAKVMGLTNVQGQTIYDDPTSWHVVGVIKDFVLESPYQPIKPMIFKGPRSGRMTLNIRLNNHYSPTQNLSTLAKIFKQFNPAFPFEYHFEDEEYAKKFGDEQLTSRLAGIFAGLTIFISCLGLLGLAIYMAENRIKEIGVRKVLGASVSNIIALLSRDFIKLVFIAILIASPIAWLVMDKWLQSFDYRVQISWTVFFLSGTSALTIAAMTISFQAIKAAIANPVSSLRSE
jgi:putative ABC transport system permease protein